ncbi:alpha/beta hydrolase [Leptolyngbya sp. BC1307]|uniref:alpha/beta hydrolase n=1 Tax=Leptolyngbya sp. BC1307 TaxID=2029589 RepID=UPI000EFBA10A|nr:alpha/beta hydrolase [Leptolyngbya sp. BC1307]
MTSTQTSSQGVSEGTFSGSNSLQLFYQSWYPPSLTETTADISAADANPSATAGSPIRGVLALIHGLGEHSGRYCNVVKALTAEGYAVFAFDNQGHGRSEGQRGHIDHWQDYRKNTQAFLQMVRQQEPTAPLFLMGHSLGGLIVLDYVLRGAQSPQFQAVNVRGIVVSAPPIQPFNSTASSARIALARLLSGLLPRLTLRMGLDKSGLSRCPEVTDQIADDPLVHSCVTLRWGTETLDTIQWVKAHIDQLQLPILLIHGEADPIIAPAGSHQIFQQIQTPDKTLNLYPGSYHEPHNDLDAEVVTADLVNWLNGCLAET